MSGKSGIVVGVDGSGHSVRALEWAAQEAALREVPLTVITVHQPVVGYWGTAVDYPQDHALSVRIRAAVREQAEKVIGGLAGNTPPRVSVDTVFGYPAAELLAAAREADLLVVGSRGVGGFARLVMGSVSSQVAQHAHCPVVVVPAADR